MSTPLLMWLGLALLLVGILIGEAFRRFEYLKARNPAVVIARSAYLCDVPFLSGMVLVLASLALDVLEVLA